MPGAVTVGQHAQICNQFTAISDGRHVLHHEEQRIDLPDKAEKVSEQQVAVVTQQALASS